MTDERTAPETEERTDGSLGGELWRAAPGIARIAAAAWWRTAGWTLGTSMRTGSRVARAAVSGESPAELFQEAGAELRQYARDLLGLIDGGGAPGEPSDSERAEAPPASRNGTASVATLRKRGEELLRRSADVDDDEDAHPAYARILEELAPDEGRILRLLALEGPQPSVDVRTGTLPINLNSQLVAPGVTMVGAEAGCRHLDRVHAYMNNLHRLGLVWFAREPIDDIRRYQVVESQPEVVEAMEKAGRSRTVRRSIHLTAFGEDFCELCLPLHTAELDALPGGTKPGAAGPPGQADVAAAGEAEPSPDPPVR